MRSDRFNVTTSRNQPLVLFAYEAREAAEAAAQQLKLLSSELFL